LAERIPQGLPVERIFEIITKMAEALAYAHERGVIHRDLKPQNILFRANGSPVLSDFGIAKVVAGDPDATQLTRLGTAIGSPRYMSPEQITSQTLDPRSDLYSLGLMLFEMLTRRQPYQADDVISLVMKHCAEPVPPLPSDLSVLQPVLDRLLAKRPGDRFDSAQELIVALEGINRRRLGQVTEDDETRLVSLATARSRRSDPVPPARAPPRSRRGLLIGGLLGLSLAAGGGAYWLFVRHPPSHPPQITAGLPLPAADRSTTASEYERQARVAELLAQARSKQDEGALPDALSLVNQAIELSPGDKDLLAFQAQAQAQLDKGHRAEKLLARCDHDFPLDQLGANELDAAAACYARAKDLKAKKGQKAQARLDQIADLSASWVKAALEAGELDKAADLLAQLRRLRAEDPRLGTLSLELQDKRDAEGRRKAQSWVAPEMVSVPAGCYEMGSPLTEAERETDEHQHKVCLKAFRIGKYEVKVKEFRRFIDATHYQTLAERTTGNDRGCWALDQSDPTAPWKYRAWANWRRPNKYRDTQEDEPVTCVSWIDAEAYISWLNKATGGTFRLPTEAEWEYAARAGTTTARYWGDGADATACKYANVADTGHKWANGFPCDDANEWVALAGTYQPNAWGLYDVLGNVSEWTCSAYDRPYDGSESVCITDSDPAVPLGLRGGSWYSGPKPVRAAYRDRNYPEVRYSFLGFRVASGLTAIKRAAGEPAHPVEPSPRAHPGPVQHAQAPPAMRRLASSTPSYSSLRPSSSLPSCAALVRDASSRCWLCSRSRSCACSFVRRSWIVEALASARCFARSSSSRSCPTSERIRSMACCSEATRAFASSRCCCTACSSRCSRSASLSASRRWLSSRRFWVS
jgi:formylglycine-generating enzyme required for sulfatase activity